MNHWQQIQPFVLRLLADPYQKEQPLTLPERTSLYDSVFMACAESHQEEFVYKKLVACLVDACLTERGNLKQPLELTEFLARFRRFKQCGQRLRSYFGYLHRFWIPATTANDTSVTDIPTKAITLWATHVTQHFQTSLHSAIRLENILFNNGTQTLSSDDADDLKLALQTSRTASSYLDAVKCISRWPSSVGLLDESADVILLCCRELPAELRKVVIAHWLVIHFTSKDLEEPKQQHQKPNLQQMSGLEPFVVPRGRANQTELPTLVREPDYGMLVQLVEMGIELDKASAALISVENRSLEAALGALNLI